MPVGTGYLMGRGGDRSGHREILSQFCAQGFNSCLRTVSEDLFRLVMFETINFEKQHTVNYTMYRAHESDMRILLLMYEKKRPEALFYYSVNMVCQRLLKQDESREVFNVHYEGVLLTLGRVNPLLCDFMWPLVWRVPRGQP